MELTPKDHNNKNFNDISLLKGEFQNKNTLRRSDNHDYYSWKLNNNPITNGICKIVIVGERAVSMTTATTKKNAVK